MVNTDVTCGCRNGARFPRLPWLVAAALAALLAGPAGAADEWVRVAAGGLGDGSRRQVDGIAVYGDHVVIAVHQAGGGSSVLRAELRSDAVWSDETPPWGAAGEVSALEVVDGVLFVATTDGQLWQRRTRSSWSPAVLPWPAGTGILHLAGWDPRDGNGVRVCVVREGQLVECRMRGGVWAPLGAPVLADPASAATAKLLGSGAELYLGIGGERAGDRSCEVWRYRLGTGWRPLTTDCFGGGPDGLTWVTDMEAFEGRVYFGTGGHTSALLLRTTPTGFEDVTPFDLYSCDIPLGGLCPIRYNALAATDDLLFAGTRTGGLGLPLADVLGSRDGVRWSPSNESGFGEELNDTITAMGSRDAYLYAGTFNGGGFQVWRRNFRLVELIPPLFRHLWEARGAANLIHRCLLPIRPCQPPWDLLFEPVEEIRLGLDLAVHGQDDPASVKEARAAMTVVREQLDTAKLLADYADVVKDYKEARRLRLRAGVALEQGLALADRTVRHLAKAHATR